MRLMSRKGGCKMKRTALFLCWLALLVLVASVAGAVELKDATLAPPGYAQVVNGQVVFGEAMGHNAKEFDQILSAYDF